MQIFEQAMDRYYSNQSDGGARMDALPSDSFMSPSVFNIEPGTLPQGLRTPDPYDPNHLENVIPCFRPSSQK